MRQATLATAGFERYSKPTRRAAFLDEMNRVVPWRELCALIEPVYPKAGRGRVPVGLERMLRIYFLQQCWGGRPHGIGCANIGSIHDPKGGPPKWSLSASRSTRPNMSSRSMA